MRGFFKLVASGVLLVTLLFVIDTIDAGRKEKKDSKSEEVDNRSPHDKPGIIGGQYESHVKPEVTPKITVGYLETQDYYDNLMKEMEIKQNTFRARRQSKNEEGGGKGRIKRSYEKVKKFKIVEDEPAEQNLNSLNIRAKKTKPRDKERVTRENLKKSKSHSHKKELREREYVDDAPFEEEADIEYNDQNIDEENASDKSKNKKYKIVQVVLEPAGEEDQDEVDEASVEVENNIEEPRTRQFSRTREIIEEANVRQSTRGKQNDHYNSESRAAKYEEPRNKMFSCQGKPDEPFRLTPRSLTFYVVQENVNGKMKKRLMKDEDGVTMCEVADLLREFYEENPEEDDF